MFRNARFPRSKKKPVAPLAEQPPADEPPAAFRGVSRTLEALKYAPAPLLEYVAVSVLRVGDYEVGAGFCPRLCGHPGIRY